MGNSLTSFLKHKGKTEAEQLQKNQAAMQLLKTWLEEEITEEESKQRESYFESFKEIVDSARMPGHKLYSQE
jgi:hypothetical protein